MLHAHVHTHTRIYTQMYSDGYNTILYNKILSALKLPGFERLVNKICTINFYMSYGTPVTFYRLLSR